MIAPRRFWLNATEQYLVEDGGAGARFLLCVPGGYISDEDARRYGLLDNNGPTALYRGEVKALGGPPEVKAMQAPPEVKGLRTPAAGRVDVKRARG